MKNALLCLAALWPCLYGCHTAGAEAIARVKKRLRLSGDFPLPIRPRPSIPRWRLPSAGSSVPMVSHPIKDVPGWTPQRIKAAMHRSSELWVTLPKPIPVYIVYLTAWVDATGRVNYRKDVYGHDAEIEERMFK
ncbi:hypothetical protein [Dinghuibacter silviterrae]|uniref:hypothetical protein n=1 Tax=Dinghuibacter silviterrae TaxID=1539049 RepID=UPI001063AFF4|nr:hypothetical protein [Dinghuibacter silviterrae]